MKYRVVRIELAPKLYVYRVLAPWNAYLGSRFTDKADALRWIKDNIRRKP